MPERERLNIDFGFAPTQVQQGDIGAAYAAPVARKSAKTKMLEGLSTLSGTLANAAIARTKRLRAEEKAWNSLSSEDKTKYDNAAKAAASATAAGDIEKANEITARYSAELVEAGKMPATHHQYFNDRLIGFTAVNDLSTKLEAHFTPERRAWLSNNDTDIDKYINKVIHGTQQDADGSTISIGLDRDTLDNLDHSLVQTLITSKKSSLTPQIQAAQDRIATENFTNNAIASMATALTTIIDDTINVSEDQINGAFKNAVGTFSTTGFKQVFNESGVNKLFPAFETTFNKYLAPGDTQNLDEAETLLGFIGHAASSGTAVHGNQTFYDMNPEKANEMLANLHAAQAKKATDIADQKANALKLMNKETDLLIEGRLYDISLGAEKADFNEVGFVDKEIEAFKGMLDPGLVDRLNKAAPDGRVYKAFINSYEAKLTAMQNANGTTEPSFDWKWANHVKDNASITVLDKFLDDSLLDKTLSAPDYVSKKTALRNRAKSEEQVQNYNRRYANNSQQFTGGLKGAIAAHSKLTMGIIDKAMAGVEITPAQAGRRAYAISILTRNAQFARSEKKRELLLAEGATNENVHEALKIWDKDLFNALQSGKIGVIGNGGYYSENDNNLGDDYRNIETLGSGTQ